MCWHRFFLAPSSTFFMQCCFLKRSRLPRSCPGGWPWPILFFCWCNFFLYYFFCMIHSILRDRPTKLFLGISAFFVANALIAESIGTKIFSLEKLVGAHPVNFTLFGQSGLAFNLTCGV